MNEFQFSCLVLVLFCFAVLVAFLLYRCADLQNQVNELRVECLKTKAAFLKRIY